jgi:hypothetical protein
MVLKGINIDVNSSEDIGIKYSENRKEAPDTMVYQMEVFPDNPYCPMGHFNTEWSMKEPGTYIMNLDLFPAVRIAEDLERVKHLMDGVADRFGRDRSKIREGLDVHYDMEHWSVPLAAKVGCKKWLEYVTLKDEAIRIGQASGMPPELLIELAYPPSAVFSD